MKLRSRYGPKAWLPYLLGLTAILLLVGLSKSLPVLDIGDEIELPVSEGDVFVHTYVHSMYQVPVSEKFRIENGHLRLFHVTSTSEAALEYFGILRNDEFNVDGRFLEFTIPAASIGKHVVHVRDREIDLGTHENREGPIRVKLTRVPVLIYFARSLWR